MADGESAKTSLATGEVVYACLHRRLRWDGASTPLYVLALADGRVFLSRRHPPVFDAANQRVREPIEITPGSTVRVLYRVLDDLRWMEAIQVLTLQAEPVPDFGPP